MVKYDRVIFTKQDEAYRKGVLWDLFGVTPVPVSYVTCGQEVPEDIQAATRDLICDMMIQGR
jgi:flagellar biosynthesis protein FlhF